MKGSEMVKNLLGSQKHVRENADCTQTHCKGKKETIINTIQYRHVKDRKLFPLKTDILE